VTVVGAVTGHTLVFNGTQFVPAFAAGPRAGDTFNGHTTLAAGLQTDQAAPAEIWRQIVNLELLKLPHLATSEVRFRATVARSNALTTAHVLLRNETDALDMAHLIFNSGTTAAVDQISADIVFPNALKEYSVTFWLIGGTPPADVLDLGWAGFVTVHTY
jgi:hypothetical protein